MKTILQDVAIGAAIAVVALLVIAVATSQMNRHTSNENLYKEQRDGYLSQLNDALNQLADARDENKALKEVNEHLSLEMRDLEKHVPTCKLPSFITTPCKITDELLQQHRPLTLRY